MKTTITILMLVAVVLGGAATVRAEQVAPNALFTVDFQQGQVLRYEFVTKRDITTEMKSNKKDMGTSKPEVSTESVDMIIAFEPIEVDRFGLSTIKATCQSVKTKRTGGPARESREAVSSMNGKTFTFTVDARGKMIDKSQLDMLFKELGKQAFRKNSPSRIKEPDMIADVVASQWFLWDAVSSIKHPSQGVAVGQSWDSVLSVPTPMVMRKARDVTYKLKEIKKTDNGKMAVIDSSYLLAEQVPAGWPVPYTGTFSMSGKFGFFRGYKVQSLQGKGTELYNIDKGQIDHYQQNFKLVVQASAMIAGVTTDIKIDQKISMKLLKD